MKNEQTMKNGLPKKYWMFRDAVSFAQILVVVAALISSTVWAFSNGNGVRLWNDYYSFSQGVSEWANTSLRMPWEPSLNPAEVPAIGQEEETPETTSYLDMCGSDRTPVFEGETESFVVSVCESTDGSLTYISWSDSLGGIELPAEDMGGYWAANNGSITYGVSENSLTVLENSSNEYILDEPMTRAVTY